MAGLFVEEEEALYRRRQCAKLGRRGALEYIYIYQTYRLFTLLLWVVTACKFLKKGEDRSSETISHGLFRYDHEEWFEARRNKCVIRW